MDSNAEPELTLLRWPSLIIAPEIKSTLGCLMRGIDNLSVTKKPDIVAKLPFDLEENST